MALVKDGGENLPAEETQDAPDGYESLVRLDQGGFAIVYRARDTRFDRTVALKILRSDTLNERQLRRFNAECLATGRVSSHPNIVTVYDAGNTPGHRPWLAMEYCSGGSLASKLARQGPLPVAEVISIGARLCSALQAAHEAGILHRDVKPHNVLLTSYGEPALADFGIASVVIQDDSVAETAAYTVVHVAPEILEGTTGTAAADIYSLASTLYTLLAGQAPFAKEASTGLAPLVTRILGNDLPVIARPGVPPDLERLLRRCMAAKPQDRPASAADVGASLTDLGDLLAAQERGSAQHPPAAREAAPGTPAPPPGSPPISASRLLLMLGGLLVILMAAFTTWGLSHGGTEPDRTQPSAMARGEVPAAEKYAPKGLVVARGANVGELIVSWTMPIRPDVLATVIYEGTDATNARAVVHYGSGRRAVPQNTLHGLPSRRRVCLSAVHLVSLDDKISNAMSRPVCAVPR